MHSYFVAGVYHPLIVWNGPEPRLLVTHSHRSEERALTSQPDGQDLRGSGRGGEAPRSNDDSCQIPGRDRALSGPEGRLGCSQRTEQGARACCAGKDRRSHPKRRMEDTSDFMA